MFNCILFYSSERVLWFPGHVTVEKTDEDSDSSPLSSGKDEDSDRPKEKIKQMKKSKSVKKQNKTEIALKCE